MKLAIITLSAEGARVAKRLTCAIPEAHLYLHSALPRRAKAKRFNAIVALSRKIFRRYDGLIYVCPTGVVVRAIAPLIRHKLTDPAVVVVDVGARYAISLLSGHEGGANALALEVANILRAEPVVTTTTEAVKNLIVGLGCRRGTASEQIVAAVREALHKVRATSEQVRLLASADIKANEKGLIEAATQLGLSLRFIASDEIRLTPRKFQRSKFVKNKVNLPAVAEPAALLAGRRTQLLLPKTILHGVTVAVARENCL
ncbi:MAG: cobalamin biosynthesis protein [Verrucomicrobia bacterium]|nr:cobalamin biosynthesis protein [Verrucomicrobiota bacterium]